MIELSNLNLMKRKSEERDKGSFLEYLAGILWRVFKKFGELIVKVIKIIIKEVW
jgi:hypothetical protein